MSGTVNISRTIWEDTAFKRQAFTEREAFMWLIMEASWKPRERRVGAVTVTLERGQLASSIRFMADAWGWQKSTVARFLERLEKRDMIGTDSGTGVTVITVRKYDEYQGAADGSGTPRKRKAGQQRDSSGTNEKKGVTPEVSPKEEIASDEAIVGEDADDPPPPSEAEVFKEAIGAFNETAERVGWPKAKAFSKARKSALRGRLKDAGGLDGWRDALAKAEASDFLCGRSGGSRPFLASFDFLLQASSFAKLMEGNYDNRTLEPRPPPRGASPQSDLDSIFAKAFGGPVQ